jgi:hypothetical protein
MPCCENNGKNKGTIKERNSQTRSDFSGQVFGV